MRILQISHAFPPTYGGVESHVQDLARRLSARGHDVMCLVGGEPHESPAGEWPHVVRRPELTVQNLLDAERQGPAAVRVAREGVARLAREIRQTYRPSIVHVHNGHHFSPLLAEAVLAEAGVPVVNTVHDRVGEYLHPHVLDMAWAHVLYASHYLCQELPTSRTHSVAWLGIDLQHFRPDGPRDPRFARHARPVLFHPARLLRWKGIHVSVAALAVLSQAGVTATLVLCGSEDIVDDQQELRAYRAELVEMAARLGVAEQVHFERFERERMGEAYRAVDLVWYPTIEPEPFGLVPLEAMATGAALVTSDCGGMRETVDHGRTGLRVPPGDAVALAAASRELLEDDRARSRMTRAALERSKDFGLDDYVDKIEDIYKEVTR